MKYVKQNIQNSVTSAGPMSAQKLRTELSTYVEGRC
jgi:hypothetical protein